MAEIVGNVVIGIGVAVVVLGLVGLLRFKEFDLKLLAGAKIDTVGFIVIVLGAVIRSGFTWFSAKALLILAIVLLVNPVVTSTLAAGSRRSRER
ncbi:monovalent cation/H(+) antiporter subunit G [Xylanimonas allomyrinae]|uniref:monovalent cation/H(+) antiporter subunit G n=1 Tax=Xylanimonas allomyrinae TaxID=2509459 RepID=UPI0013A60D2F|nr:monovalent cation/H(+) antiporter subunit G [Xylanimonas allomyrinae]